MNIRDALKEVDERLPKESRESIETKETLVAGVLSSDLGDLSYASIARLQIFMTQIQR